MSNLRAARAVAPVAIVTAVAVGVLSVSQPPNVAVADSATTPPPGHTYNYSGSSQTTVVPAGVRGMEVQAEGGAGGLGDNYENPGIEKRTASIRIKGIIRVHPGEVISVAVGGNGTNANTSGGGWAALPALRGGGGGKGNNRGKNGGGGGGATTVFVDGYPSVIVGGAGGNGGKYEKFANQDQKGHAGGASGLAAGVDGGKKSGNTGGRGGVAPHGYGTAGGNGTHDGDGGGGGGGGGFYSGEGGDKSSNGGGGGGGASSIFAGVQQPTLSPGHGSGQVVLNWILGPLSAVDGGGVAAWGDNTGGQLNVPAAAHDHIEAVAGGWFNAVALTRHGQVIAWGSDKFPPGVDLTQVPAAAKSGIVAIAAGPTHFLALNAAGRVIGWGDNSAQQSAVPGGAMNGVTAIAGGMKHSLALKTNGSVIGWGSNAHHQQVTPAEATSQVTAIAAGNYTSYALKTDGGVIAWGDNAHGERNVPEAARHHIVAISASGSSAAALTSDGSVIGWGKGVAHVPATLHSGVSAISVGDGFGFAIKDGAVISWGTGNHLPTDARTVPPIAQAGVQAVSAGYQLNGYTIQTIDK